MNKKFSRNYEFNRMFVSILSIVVIVMMAFPATTTAHAAPDSPFMGHWEAIDVDGSDMQLTIAGRPTGPFQITWTDDYISFCDGEAGLVRGTGEPNESDPNLLEADVHLACFTTGETLDFHVTFRYHPATNTLSVRWWFGQVTIWHRPGNPPAAPLALNLRVNYGHDWVESFYEAGHTAWVTVTDADGNVKATTELDTEPKDYWNGEAGFQSLDSVWFDGDGNQMENPPDIQPYDWVYGWVDNGASAQVQIGDISGTIDLANDTISGTINASWFSDPVQVECLDWGSGQEPPFDNAYGGNILPDGSASYSCSWDEWDIQPYQDIGVGYSGPDGNWVANAIYALNPRIVASEAGDWFWMTEFKVGTLALSLYESADEGAEQLWSGTTQVTDPSGITFVGYDMHGQDMMPGNYLVVSDGVNSKGLVLETITVDLFDTENEIMAGTAPLGRDVWAAAGPQEWQERIMVTADSETGAWSADFNTIEFDITEDMRGWSSAAIYDEDGDTNETSSLAGPPNPHFTVFPEGEWFDALDWPEGATVTITVADKPECSLERVSPGNFFNGGFPDGCDVQFGDTVTFTDGQTLRTHTVQNLAITDVDKVANTISGTADIGAVVHAWIHEHDGSEMQLPVENGTWLADFGSHDFDLVEGTCGRSEIRDEFGNSTAVDWCIPRPWLNAFPEWDVIYSYEWPAYSDVDLTINGQFVQTVTVGPTSWDPNVYTAYFDFKELYDLKPGDVVTLSGSGMELTYTVQNLTVTAVDEIEDTVSGTADANAEIVIFPHATWQQLWVTADENGNWRVDFTGTFDLVPGECGRAEIRDGLDNSTAVDWCIPNSRIVASITEDWYYVNEFAPNTELDFAVYASQDGALIWEGTTAATDGSGSVWVDAEGRWDLEPGNYLVVSDGNSAKDLVIEGFTFDVFDVTQGVLQGTVPGQEGRHVWVGIGFENDGWSMDITTDETGAWIADFGQPVPSDYQWVAAQIFDDDGDAIELRPEQILE
jgi:hypothetical protein